MVCVSQVDGYVALSALLSRCVFTVEIGSVSYGLNEFVWKVKYGTERQIKREAREKKQLIHMEKKKEKKAHNNHVTIVAVCTIRSCMELNDMNVQFAYKTR